MTFYTYVVLSLRSVCFTLLCLALTKTSDSVSGFDPPENYDFPFVNRGGENQSQINRGNP